MSNVIGAVFSIKDQFSSQIKTITGAAKKSESVVKQSSNTLKGFGKGFEGSRITREVSKIDKSFKKSEAEVKKSDNVVKRFGTGFRDKISSKLNTVKKSFNDTEKETKQAKEEVGRFNNNLNGGKINGYVGKLTGLAAGYISVRSAVSVATGALSGAADMEGYRNTLNVVMKDQKKAADMFKFSVKSANATPFDTEDVVKGNVRLTSYGINAKKVFTQVGDMAGVMGTNYIDAVEAVADAQTGELERLKSYGITKTQIVDHAGKLMRGKEVVNNKGQITDQENFNKAMFSLMEERFSGGMVKQANTFKGAMSTIKGVASNTLAQLAGITEDGSVKAGGALDVFKTKVVDITKTIQNWADNGGVDRATKSMEKGFKVAGKVAKGLGKTISWVKNNMDLIVPVAAGVTSAIATIKIGAGISKGITAFKKLKTAMKGIKTASGIVKVASTALLGPFGWVALAIGAVVGVGVLLYKNWDTIKAKAEQVFPGIGAKVSSAMDTVKSVVKIATDFVKGVWDRHRESVANIVSNLWETVKKLFSFALEGLKFYVNIALEGIKLYWSIFGDTLKSLVSGIWGGIKLIFSGALKVIEGASQVVLGVLSGDWNKTWNGIKTMFSGVIDIIKGVWNGLVTLLSHPLKATVDILDTLFHEKIQSAKDAWDSFKRLVQNPIVGTINLIRNGSVSGTAPSRSRSNSSRARGSGGTRNRRPQATGPGGIPVGANYKGTNNWRGGLTTLHEKGEEIYDLPSGTRIYPHGDSMDIARNEGRREALTLRESKSSNNFTIHVHNPVVREDNDINSIAKAIVRELEKVKANMA